MKGQLSSACHPLPVAQSTITRYSSIIMKAVALPALFSLFFIGVASCQDSSSQKGSNLPKSKMKEHAVDSKNAPPEGYETISLGAGCFWCVEAVYQQLEGVHSVVSGYMGGFVPNPTYEQICQKNTGHIEVVQVVYDPKKISTSDVLAWFWELHDPTSKDQQGADKGPQYRSAVFYHSEEQKKLTEASKKEAQKIFSKPIVTEVRKAEKFWVAEDEHQNFYFLNKRRNGYCRVVIQPKLLKLKLKN
jgi:peptide-methionine (S)-S-oxide reductase